MYPFKNQSLPDKSNLLLVNKTRNGPNVFFYRNQDASAIGGVFRKISNVSTLLTMYTDR